MITKRERPIARLVPARSPMANKEIFARIRALQSRLSLGKNETARDLIKAGRRI